MTAKTLLRKLVLSCVLCLVSCISLKAQWVSIPDTNFGTWLNNNGYTACMQGDNTVGWQMDTTCPAVVNATSVDCRNSMISDLEGIQYFDGLATLNCYLNNLTSLPALPTGLTQLICIQNQLTILPALPSGLAVIECYDNQLTSLPALPSGLTYLSCYSNQLSNLPALPAGLTYLNCGLNLLTTLPALPTGLTTFRCEGNQLTNLPALPSSLTYLNCYSNQLTNLPALPSGLTYLSCQYNLLTSLPEFPDSLHQCYIYANPITCLPRLKQIDIFYFYNTQITCLPNYGNVIISVPDSLPLCDSANANGCAYCHAFFSVYPDSLNQGVYYGFNQSYGSNLTSYLWEFGDGDTSSLPYPSHNYAQPGQYYVCLTVSSAECTNTYCDSSFYVFKTEGGLMSELHIIDPATGISQIHSPPSGFYLSPNPASNTVTIELDESLIGGIVTVSDVTGRKMITVQLSTRNTQLMTSNLANGIYFVTIEVEGNRTTKKLVIER